MVQHDGVTESGRGRRAGHGPEGANQFFAAAAEARKSLDFHHDGNCESENFKQQSALIRVFYKSHLRVVLRMESVKDGKSGGRETTQEAVAVIQVRADNCLADKSCLTFPDSADSSPSGSSVPGISQARILEWAAISFSRESSQSSDHNHNSCMAGGFFTTEPPENAQRWLLVIESLSHV